MLAFNYNHFAGFAYCVDDLWHFLKGLIFDCVERFVPKIAKKSKHHNPWITQGTLRMRRKLQRLKKRNARKWTMMYNWRKLWTSCLQQLKTKIAEDIDYYHSALLPDFIRSSPEKFWRVVTLASLSSDTFFVKGENVRDEKIACAAFDGYLKRVYTMIMAVCHAFLQNCLPFLTFLFRNKAF